MGDQDPGSDEGTDFLLADEAAATGGHPAWQEILDAVPEDYRDALRPTLEKWDKGVQARFQSLHSKYEPLKPYLDEADKLEMGMNLLRRIEEDPRAVYDLMAATYNFAEQGATEDEGTMSELTFDPDSVDPAVLQQMQALQEQQDRLAQQLAEQQQRDEEEENRAQLDAYVSWLHEEHGEFDDDYVITLLANGIEGPDAVQRYNDIVAKAAGAPATPPAPKVMPSGGGVPSRAIDPTKLSSSETKDLVTEMLIQAQQQ